MKLRDKSETDISNDRVHDKLETIFHVKSDSDTCENTPASDSKYVGVTSSYKAAETPFASKGGLQRQ
jgi:hypothetical protein